MRFAPFDARDGPRTEDVVARAWGEGTGEAERPARSFGEPGRAAPELRMGRFL